MLNEMIYSKGKWSHKIDLTTLCVQACVESNTHSRSKSLKSYTNPIKFPFVLEVLSLLIWSFLPKPWYVLVKAS